VLQCVADFKEGVGLNHMPSGGFAANAAWLVLASIAHNLARWTTRLGGISERVVTTATLRRRYLAVPGQVACSGRKPTLHVVTTGYLGDVALTAVRQAWHRTPRLTSGDARRSLLVRGNDVEH